jgi:hypothetical protein
MRKCSRCILPASVPGIEFDSEGVCNFCREYKRKKYLGEEKLAQIFGSVQALGRKYDCLVPLSGGRDSTFVLYFARVKYNLKIIGVHYDNEFSTKEAITNVNQACERLNVDLSVIRSKRNIAHKIVKYRLASLTSLSSGAGACWACAQGYRRAVYGAALKSNTPLILWGSGDNEYIIDIQSKAFAHLKQNPTKYRKILKLNFYIAEFYQFLQRLESPVPGNSLFKRGHPSLKNDAVKEIRLFDYIPWERKKVEKTIVNELGWQKPSERVSSWKADCKINELVNFICFSLFGCSLHCFGYTGMINEGQMTREEALAQEEKMSIGYDANIHTLLIDEIGLSKRKAETLMNFVAQFSQ